VSNIIYIRIIKIKERVKMIEEKIIIKKFKNDGFKMLNSNNHDDVVKGLNLLEDLIVDGYLTNEEIDIIKTIVMKKFQFGSTICLYIDYIVENKIK
jgi:hypothetical protein